MDDLSSSNTNAKRKNFRWDPGMIEQLIDSLLEYKSQMSYKGIDFDGDKPMQYKELRLLMAKIYREDVTLFGPVGVVRLPDDLDELPKEEQALAKERFKKSKELVARGTKRVMEKVKEIRQNFSKAVISGKRSGSGKIIFEFYDKLVLLWGGSANVAPLTYGVSGDDFEEEDETMCDDQDDLSVVATEVDVTTCPELNNIDETQLAITPTSKRKASCVPQLIDNKRKHLEKTLSAAQRDKMLIEEAKEDAKLRKELLESVKESSAAFAQGIKDVSKAISDLGTGLSQSIHMLSHGLHHGYPPQPVNQNMFYQNPQFTSQSASTPSVYTSSPMFDQSHSHQYPGNMHHHH